MQMLATGLWGCFFGGSFLVVCGAVFAYRQGMRRIGINASLAALGPVLVVICFLGILPISEHSTLLRFLTFLTAVVGALLVYQLLNILGELATALRRRQARITAAAVIAGALAASWALQAPDALLACILMVAVMAFYAWSISVVKAWRGDSLAWVAVVAVVVVVAAYSGLAYNVLHPGPPDWPLLAFSGLAASIYVVSLGGINYLRYAHLIERKKAMLYGPSYDPITRLRSRSGTHQMAQDIFDNPATQNEPLGLVVLTIANLYSLEKLHGMAAVNSALFLMASRLKGKLPARVEIGRLGFDGFLLIMRNCNDSGRLVLLAHELIQRLQKAAALKTNPDADQLETAQTVWQADVGVGVLHVKHAGNASVEAITVSRNMSRTAISYASRVAWFDQASAEIVELPRPAVAL